ncbi:MAG: hypothetical protein LUC27_08850 [Lachnospiraceae bacterium]|nr:hypothetical protein [Lachnospiraceae bacterium]
MLTIAAVVIGDTFINGGKGNYAGTVAGCVILYVLNGLLPLSIWGRPGRTLSTDASFSAFCFSMAVKKKIDRRKEWNDMNSCGISSPR